jgi:hypothetical protein
LGVGEKERSRGRQKNALLKQIERPRQAFFTR